MIPYFEYSTIILAIALVISESLPFTRYQSNGILHMIVRQFQEPDEELQPLQPVRPLVPPRTKLACIHEHITI